MVVAVALACACGAGRTGGTSDSGGSTDWGNSSGSVDAGTTTGASDAGSMPGPSDAGSTAGGGLVLTDAGHYYPPVDPGPADAGPFPDGGLIWLPEPAPERTQQAATWTATGAVGCDGIVPATVAPRLAWAPADPSMSCLWDPVTDGQGDLAVELLFTRGTWSTTTAFIPIDGTPSFGVERGSTSFDGFAAREEGFTIGASAPGSLHWQINVGPGGAEESIASGIPPYATFVATNGLGSFVQTTYWMDPNTIAPNGFPLKWYLLRWTDAAGNALTPWYGVMSTYYVNFDPTVYVDLLGNALVVVGTTYPMSMPCSSGPTYAAWVAPDGTVERFAPVTSLGATPYCDVQQGAGFGSAVALPGGGFAFYLPPPMSPDFAYAPSAWYASYASMTPASTDPPGWLTAYAAPIERLASGAYLSVQRDKATCALTAQLTGLQGQLCATLLLDGSADCTARVNVKSDGTVVMYVQDKCALTFWPHLAR